MGHKMARLLLTFVMLLPLLSGCGDAVTDGASRSAFLQALEISAGDFHTCARVDGTVECWGENSSGQLGDGSEIGSLNPVAVSGILTASRISAGGSHTCALLADGTVKCWGENSNGQLGDGTTARSATPVTVTGLTGATSISAGGSHTCAVLSDGTVKCWGRNVFGTLGNGSNANSSLPVTVSGINTATAVSAGGSHTCALLADSTAVCWGSSSVDQLGNEDTITGAASNIPVAVTGLANTTSISAGTNHTCAVINSGAVRCWGDNSSGQLGSFWTIISLIPVINDTNSRTPLTVTGVSSATAVAAGLAHSCAVLSSGKTVCWGENANGQLGNGNVIGFVPPGAGATSTSTIVPVEAVGITSAEEAAAGLFHSCARLSNSSVLCWGDNSNGQLGNGSTISSTIPAQVVD
ncbi:MAG: hypothetical protein A2V21_306990 [Deltaproteobacteria bacterium GWC2_55_46]|nr:MAG: hypothetical protein A2Z79_01080 [Deltaproteobacteria bacterium GWA2_55_82]OIJ74029.1 MAG: hypothetical protein A2V21_306990 [Deltaproteobacteria bacterium GWC2_55_46]